MTEYNSPTLAAPVAAPVEAAPAAVADVPSNASRSNMAGTVAALGVAAATFAVAKQAKAVVPSITFDQIPGTGDAKVLNFALTLEALESELYTQAIQRLSTGGTGGDRAAPGTQIPGMNVGDTQIDLKYLRTFEQVELAHRSFLDNVLGGNSILRSQGFSNMRFDFGIGALTTRAQVMEIILDAERTGVAAYLGGIKFISDKGTRQIAAAIQGVEARHTSLIYIAINRLARNGVTGFGATPRNVAPIQTPLSSPGRNDLDTVGRELTSAQDATGVPLITRGTPGVFLPQPRSMYPGPNGTKSGLATPDNVLDKVSPFIVL